MIADLRLIIPAAVVLVFLAIYIHEAGHALMGWLCGCEVTSFGSGTGRLIWVWNCRGLRIYFGLKNPFQGVTWMIFQQLFPSRLAMAGVFSGGVLANMMAASVALLLWWVLPWGKSLLLLTAVVNVLIGLPNLLPFSFRVGGVTMQSDAAVILQTLRRRTSGTSASAVFQMVESFSSFLQAIGDVRILHFHRLTAAALWCELGDATHALTYCAQAASLPLHDTLFSRAYRSAVRGMAQSAAGDLDAATASLDEAHVLFAELRHEGGLCLVALSRANLALRKQEPTIAFRVLEALQSQRLVATSSALGTGVFLALLDAQAVAGAVQQVNELRIQYANVRRRNPSSARDRQVGLMLGEFYMKQGHVVQAAQCFRMALEAACGLYCEFSNVDDQSRFRKCQEPLLEQAGNCLRQLGNAEEALHLAPMYFPNPEQVAQNQRQILEKRQRTFRRAGWMLMAINLIVGVMMLVWVKFYRDANPATGLDWVIIPAILGFFFVVFALVAGFIGIVTFLLRWLLPQSRATYTLLPLFGIIPWIMTLVVIPVSLVLHYGASYF